MKVRRGWMISCLLGAAICCQAGESRALLIAVSHYPAHSGWIQVHGDNDLTLLIPVLDRFHFEQENRLILKDEAATYQAITQALQLLGEQASEGDNVWIHFSGHGQQMEDDNGDEPDGLDESLIPYNAQMYYQKGIYEGENHLRDDELNRYLTTIRRKLGETGSLWVSLDACHSGSATRGEEDEWMRGAHVVFSANPGFLPPEKSESSYIDTPLLQEEGLSPLTVLSACRADQNNYEYKSGDKWYGVLTYAFCQVMNSRTTWPEPKELIGALKAAMSKLTSKQRPVFETTQK